MGDGVDGRERASLIGAGEKKFESPRPMHMLQHFGDDITKSLRLAFGQRLGPKQPAAKERFTALDFREEDAPEERLPQDLFRSFKALHLLPELFLKCLDLPQQAQSRVRASIGVQWLCDGHHVDERRGSHHLKDRPGDGRRDIIVVMGLSKPGEAQILQMVNGQDERGTLWDGALAHGKDLLKCFSP